MADGKFVSYLRVSTQRQGQSGLGLEAQQDFVLRFLNGGKHELLGEFVEIESGRKGSKNRPQLMAALAECKAQKATLIIAKLDRLSRDVRFFLEVLDDSKVDIRFAEFADIDPKTDEGRMILIGMANFAEFEGRRIGARTKAAIAAKKMRVENGTDKSGHKNWCEAWGTAGTKNLRPNVEDRQKAAQEFAERLRPLFDGMKARKVPQRQMAEELNASKTPTQRGKKWTQTQVNRVLARLG
jgi:DNA invertase Pin-like site-specific DNA recombinase